MSARSAVVLREVKKAFPLRGGLDLEALDLEHLVLPVGSCTALRGRSGSGKTTLLNLIAGVTVPTAGTVCVDDTDVFALSEARRDRFRAEHVGYVFQTINLLSALSALENVMLAMMFATNLAFGEWIVKRDGVNPCGAMSYERSPIAFNAARKAGTSNRAIWVCPRDRKRTCIT